VWTDDGSPAGSVRRVRVVGTTPLTLLGESLAVPSRALVQLGA
jgi:hypothetical protein